ncbi:hypothetical protein FEM03_08905 [Phragmitibacter flavus]|uniref:Glycoside hydrolase family 42 N-terminal domain-containing protein n=1 Tax=Phragmitibacter flavus TaxID=2576071 RepID=A0A5R8KFF2_9BACT|nr:beta-galactosidase [Phragmitibacter flavus]TLD71024.1 hypothetical protein FEM03_08905 [Phragmitibacter flavus]
MKQFLFGLGVWFLTAAMMPAQTVGVRLLNEGMEIEAGSVGKLVLDYPKLFDEGQKVESKLIAREVGKESALLSYEGGSKLRLDVGKNGEVGVVFVERGADAKFLILEMQIPIGFNQGGSWKIGDKMAAFPVQKPEGNPHLFQGNAESLTVVNFEGRSLTVKPPGFSFLQLSDNREWNWPIFFWKSITPVEAHAAGGMTIELALGGDGKGAKPLVDLMGQSMRAEWADKVRDLEELKGDVAAEEKYFGGLPDFERDEFGGLQGSREKLGLKATGFFHVEKKEDGRWLLVNPVGNAFFHLGVCGFNPNDDYTLTKGRESAYEWLPESKGEFESVFRTGSEGTVVSFHLANQIRKYGAPFEANAYAARMIGRLRKWGFSSVGAFTDLSFGAEARKVAKFPGVAHLPINAWEKVLRIAGIHEVFDPFDEATRRQIEENMAAFLPAHADDPLIIGYYIVNEPIYEQIPVIVPSLKGSEHACKRRLVEWLTEKYGSVAKFNEAWGMKMGGFEELLEPGLPMTTDAAKADAVAFAEVFLEAYMTLVKESFRRHDPNHLLLGSRLQPATIKHEWICRVMGRHVDVMSFNYYTYGLDKEFLKQVHGWTGGKPMMLSEFFWSSPTDSGLTGGREVGSQQERGLAYRNYVEQAASLGFVVGTEWFTMVDQSVTGRWFSGFDGERANTGLISVVDRPWKGLLEEMMKAHRAVYPVWLGEQAPFSSKDPRFTTGE